MPTLKEIIYHPAVGTCDEGDVMRAMSAVMQHASAPNYVEFYEGGMITGKNVVDVSYDHRRGARTTVLFYSEVPFAVVSMAGRELDDDQAVYIVDVERTFLAIAELLTWDSTVRLHDLKTPVSLLYWEGTPVQLGDHGRIPNATRGDVW